MKNINSILQFIATKLEEIIAKFDNYIVKSEAEGKYAAKTAIADMAKKSDLDTYAKLSSPTFTGNPQSSGMIESNSNSNTLATTKWVKDRITEASIAGTDAISVSQQVEQAYNKLGWTAPQE